MDLSTALILILVPVLALLEWRHRRQRKKMVREITEMLERHREGMRSELPPEEG